ncbi:MAG: NERD domain-containing protein [Betaproteobacteria bacterium]|nr:NERD domain-containing protein [Betaproteobacteria bacterium]
MATLIPSYASCAGRMTPGERRFAQRLESKLEEDYLCWYDVPIGVDNAHPDFIVLHPRRGLLILEVKDWKPATLQTINPSEATILTERGLKHVINPLEQARQYAHAVVRVLEGDPKLCFTSGREQGRLRFPWSYGVVLTNITRKNFDESGIAEAIEPGRAICQDEMLETVDVEAFQQRLWEMFRVRFPGALHLPQLDRIRWLLFPEVRIPAQPGLFDGEAEDLAASVQIPDLMRVMDLQQEQLARSLGDGHRVIHGVAGSGKTMILGYRAEQLARASSKPVLVLCYNKTLAVRLQHWMQAKGVADKVNVLNFHAWCRRQLVAYNVDLPHNADTSALMDEMVQRVIDACSRGQIPGAQYAAVLIDEGHDFRPEWFKLVVQMVDPRSDSLLVLYDDAQSIYDARLTRGFSFKGVGIQAQGRTTILKLNYRNTCEILDFAARFAQRCIEAADADDDGIPRLSPISAGRHGEAPIIVRLPSLTEEGSWIAARLHDEHERGMPWRDMAILYRHYDPTCKAIRAQLKKVQIPTTWKDDIRFDDAQDTVRLLPFHSSKGLEFPLVIVADAPQSEPSQPFDEEEARLLYVAMTRATDKLVLTSNEASIH